MPERKEVFFAFESGWKEYKEKEKQAGFFLADAYYKIRAEELKLFFNSKLKRGTKILHIACGTGKWSIPLLEERYKVFHFELSMHALKIAKEKTRGYRVYSIRGDAFNLPFKNEVFDAVISFGFLEHFDEIEELIKEMKRVLKKKGIFFADIASGKTLITKVERWCNFFLYLPHAFLRLKPNKIKSSLWFIKKNYYENNYSPYHYLKIMNKLNFKKFLIRPVRLFPLLKLPHKIDKILYPLFLRMKKFFVPNKTKDTLLLKSSVWELTGIKE